MFQKRASKRAQSFPMTEAWPRLQRMFIAAFFALGASSAAHEFKLGALMNTFVKIDTNEAHLVIRVPLYLFKSVRFPVKGAEIDVAKSSDAMERALAVRDDSGACARAPLRAGRPRGDEHPLGDCCPYRLALDGRALGRAVEARVAESRLGRRRCGSALDCGAVGRWWHHRLCRQTIALRGDE